MPISQKTIEDLSLKYGDSFYLLDTAQFELNYNELQRAFRAIYPNSYIAYSYKTNYTPALCKIVDRLGGFAEVVSGMELEIALRSRVAPENIYFNGPYKHAAAVGKLLLNGGTVNIDSAEELNLIRVISENNPNATLNVGIRCNFDINDGVVSRFGFDTSAKDFRDTIAAIRAIKNVNLAGLQCHFATRSLEAWPPRAAGMLKLIKEYFSTPPQFISLGGGLFGKMGESLKAQFSSRIPAYTEYAKAAATPLKEFYMSTEPSLQPKLLIEPGSALAGDVMKFAAKVSSIKDIRGKKIATLSGSIYNINPTLNKKNPPLTIIHPSGNANKQQSYADLDFGGYTCIESDYLCRGYAGPLAVGDIVMFENVGSYSLVLKPPFILPNFPVITYDEKTKMDTIIKRQENFDDLFHTFVF